MTMDEENTTSSLTRRLGRQPKGVEGAGRRHNAEVFVGAGDDPAFWHAEGVYIENNTIVNCQRGITVERVPKSQNARAGFRSDGKLEFHPSRVENNIVVFGHALGEGAAHGIRIGSSSGDADQQCLAWNPFTNPFGDDPDQTGNPWVPVKYNCVWNPTGQGTPFEGAQWYRSGYGSPSNRVHGETSQNPLLDENNGYLPAVESNGEGSYQRLNNISPTNDPILGKGNPYKIDAVKSDGNYYGMRRSMGAYEVRDTSLSLEDYYWAQLD